MCHVEQRRILTRINGTRVKSSSFVPQVYIVFCTVSYKILCNFHLPDDFILAIVGPVGSGCRGLQGKTGSLKGRS